MNNIVTTILSAIDGVILNTGQTLFNSTVIQVSNVAFIMLSLLIILIGINTSLNVYKMSMRDSMQIIVRIVLVLIVGLSWNNFEVIFNALTNATQGLALSFFAPFKGEAGAATATQALDGFGDQMAQTTDNVAQAVSSYFRSLVAFFLNVILALLMAAYVIVVGASKIVIAFLIGFAPFAMICTVFDRTKTIFEGWLTTLVANLFYPIVAAGIVGTIVTVAQSIFQEGASDSILGDFMAFIVLMLAGAMAILKIPSIAHGLTGSFGVASFGPKPLTAAGAAFGGAAGATYAGRKMSNKLDAMRDTMRSGARRADHADYDGLSRDDRKSLDRTEELRAKGQEMMRKNVMLAKMREEFREKGPK